MMEPEVLVPNFPPVSSHFEFQDQEMNVEEGMGMGMEEDQPDQDLEMMDPSTMAVVPSTELMEISKPEDEIMLDPAEVEFEDVETKDILTMDPLPTSSFPIASEPIVSSSVLGIQSPYYLEYENGELEAVEEPVAEIRDEAHGLLAREPIEKRKLEEEAAIEEVGAGIAHEGTEEEALKVGGGLSMEAVELTEGESNTVLDIISSTPVLPVAPTSSLPSYPPPLSPTLPSLTPLPRLSPLSSIPIPSLPTIYLTYPSKTYLFFPPADSALLEGADEILFEDEQDGMTVYFGKLKDLVGRLHNHFPEFREEQMAMVISFGVLDIKLSEDDVAAHHLTLHDIDRVYSGCRLEQKLVCRLEKSQRFICRFNALVEHVRTLNENEGEGQRRSGEVEEEAAGSGNGEALPEREAGKDVEEASEDPDAECPPAELEGGEISSEEPLEDGRAVNFTGGHSEEPSTSEPISLEAQTLETEIQNFEDLTAAELDDGLTNEIFDYGGEDANGAEVDRNHEAGEGVGGGNREQNIDELDAGDQSVMDETQQLDKGAVLERAEEYDGNIDRKEATEGYGADVEGGELDGEGEDEFGGEVEQGEGGNEVEFPLAEDSDIDYEANHDPLEEFDEVFGEPEGEAVEDGDGKDAESEDRWPEFEGEEEVEADPNGEEGEYNQEFEEDSSTLLEGSQAETTEDNPNYELVEAEAEEQGGEIQIREPASPLSGEIAHAVESHDSSNHPETFKGVVSDAVVESTEELEEVGGAEQNAAIEPLEEAETVSASETIEMILKSPPPTKRSRKDYEIEEDTGNDLLDIASESKRTRLETAETGSAENASAVTN